LTQVQVTQPIIDKKIVREYRFFISYSLFLLFSQFSKANKIKAHGHCFSFFRLQKNLKEQPKNTETKTNNARTNKAKRRR
jgi:hypothetical protein